jgi:transcriptional regulator with XRE-family HTH domain
MASRLGTKLRKLRIEKGFTLDALAEKSGLSKSYIWELENRESQRPSAEKLTSLADVFGLTPAYFLEDDARSPGEQHRDLGFFRAYQQLDTDAKQQLQKILETFKKDT